MRIKDFSIDNLYYEYAFSHTLDEHVNIIVGNNGTFKTTLLRLLRHAIAYEKNGQRPHRHPVLPMAVCTQLQQVNQKNERREAKHQLPLDPRPYRGGGMPRRRLDSCGQRDEP